MSRYIATRGPLAALLVFVFSTSIVGAAVVPGTPVTPMLWLESNVGVTTSGASVTGWADQSGNGRNASVPGGSTAPTLVTGVQTALTRVAPVVRFDGVNNALTGLTTGASLNGMEAFIVARLATTTIANGGVASLATASAADFQSGGAIAWTAGSVAGAPTGGGIRYNNPSGWAGDNLTLAMGHFHVYDMNVGNVAGIATGNVTALDTTTFSINTPVVNANGGAFTTESPTYYALGARALGGGSVGFFGKVDIAAVILYDAPLSSADRAAVTSYLTLAYVPEPGVALLLAPCLAAITLRRRCAR